MADELSPAQQLKARMLAAALSRAALGAGEEPRVVLSAFATALVAHIIAGAKDEAAAVRIAADIADKLPGCVQDYFRISRALATAAPGGEVGHA